MLSSKKNIELKFPNDLASCHQLIRSQQEMINLLLSQNKKDKIDKHLEKGKSWKNMAFAILESTKFDIELFDNPRDAYLDWLESNVEDLKAPNEDLENRGCSVVQVETCYYPGAQAATDEKEDLENRYDPYCVYTEEWTCDGGDSSCMECGGGSSGSSGGDGAWGFEDNELPFICISKHNLTKIGSSYYVIFGGFSYNFLHHESGITVTISFQERCLNIPDNLSLDAIPGKIKWAMENSIYGVEGWLERWYEGTIPDPAEVEDQFKYQLRTNLNSLVTVGSSITTSPGACTGVPITPTRFQC